MSDIAGPGTSAAALAVASYAGAGHAAGLARGMRKLYEIHGPRDRHSDLRCRECRDSRGRPVPWPCRTFTEMAAAFGVDPGAGSVPR